MLNVFAIPLCFAVTFAQERLKDMPLTTDFCRNGGVLVNGACVCTLRYEGKQCEQERCLNGGRRHAVSGQVRCHCPFGLSGERCEKVTYCEPDKGKLVNGKCECNTKWTGLFCHMRTCYNGIPTGGMEGFCLCDIGFTGPFCDVPLICKNGGKVNQVNVFRCRGTQGALMKGIIDIVSAQCRANRPRFDCASITHKRNSKEWRNEEGNECSCASGYTGERCELCVVGYVQEGSFCIPEVTEASLAASHAGPLPAKGFAWPFLLVGCVAAGAVTLLTILVTVAMRRWNAKTSRESSVRGKPDATDV